MKIISIIDNFEIIDKILKHLDLWDIRNHDPPQQKVSDSVLELVCDETNSRIPVTMLKISSNLKFVNFPGKY